MLDCLSLFCIGLCLLELGNIKKQYKDLSENIDSLRRMVSDLSFRDVDFEEVD